MGIGGLGMWEVLLIFLVVLLLFGAKRLPEIGSSLGKGIREFKGSIREIENEIKAPDHKRSIHAPPTSGPGAATEQTRETQESRSASTTQDDGEPRRLSTD